MSPYRSLVNVRNWLDVRLFIKFSTLQVGFLKMKSLVYHFQSQEILSISVTRRRKSPQIFVKIAKFVATKTNSIWITVATTQQGFLKA